MGGGDYRGNECMRQTFEPLFYQYGVDMSLSGHVHTCEEAPFSSEHVYYCPHLFRHKEIRLQSYVVEVDRVLLLYCIGVLYKVA